jgi:hypothetical protein
MNETKAQPMFERHRDLEDRTDGPDVLSAIEASEKGAAPLVGTGERVGLRAESAEALARSWESRAEELRIRASDHRNHGRGFSALKNDEHATALYDCVNELRRQAGLPTVRQPEPNAEVSHDQNGEPKP